VDGALVGGGLVEHPRGDLQQMVPLVEHLRQ
jgi:hypothetical protein